MVAAAELLPEPAPVMAKATESPRAKRVLVNTKLLGSMVGPPVAESSWAVGPDGTNGFALIRSVARSTIALALLPVEEVAAEVSEVEVADGVADSVVATGDAPSLEAAVEVPSPVSPTTTTETVVEDATVTE